MLAAAKLAASTMRLGSELDDAEVEDVEVMYLTPVYLIEDIN